MRYHSANNVVPTGNIASMLDNLALDSTTDQSHINQLTAKICQLTETNNIMEDQLNQLAESNVILERQGK